MVVLILMMRELNFVVTSIKTGIDKIKMRMIKGSREDMFGGLIAFPQHIILYCPIQSFKYSYFI